MSTTPGSGPGISSTLAFAICVLLAALAADLMQPLGPFALVLALVFLVAAILSFALSLFPPTRALFSTMLVFSIVAVLAFGGVFGLQRVVAPRADGVREGVFTTLLPPLRGLQQVLITQAPRWDGRPPPEAEAVVADIAPPPLSPADQTLQTLSEALASTDPAQRLRGGVTALDERDPAVLAAVIDKLYRSGDPAVRQLAVKRLLTQRRGARMPLIATAPNAEAQAFANALQTLTIRSLNETSGAFDGALCAPGMSGAVNRNGVTISARCRIGDAERNIVATLQPTDDYVLVGEARNDLGQTVRLELPLM